ncbi:MAG: cyclic nucleotide-binding domain-containing protein [Oscillospiraceae bacterium]
MMLSTQYLTQGDTEGAMEAMRNVYLARYDAPPAFDAFRAYLETQAQWGEGHPSCAAGALCRSAPCWSGTTLRAGDPSGQGAPPKAHSGELLAVLAKLPVFSVFTEQEHAILFDYCHVKTYYEHETVFVSGDHNEEVCLVLKGRLRLVANREANGSAAPLEIAYLTPGSFLGENCLSHSVFRLSGTAAEFTELLCLSKIKLKLLLELPSRHWRQAPSVLSCEPVRKDHTHQRAAEGNGRV